MPKNNLNVILETISQKLEELQHSLNSSDEILSFNQLAVYLDLSKSYLYKLTMSGKIPHYKPMGKRLYFSKREIDNWVKTNLAKEIEREGK